MTEDPPPPTTPTTPPRARPRYDLVSLIATGGMGQVWKAEDTLLDREVAVKLLKPEYAGDGTFRSRFEVEAQLAAGIAHPHVASVLDFGDHEDPDGGPPRPMLVMELVDGRPLSALIGDPELTHERAGDLVAQAGEGLAAAHRQGIVHRDVKPGNLLVTHADRVKVTDFGIARAADAASLTLTGHLVGTPHYLSPEQAEGGRATAASDVYSLGVVLFECLAGAKPFESDSPVVTAMRHVSDPLPSLPDSVPQRLRDVVERACAKDASARFADGAEMAAALRGETPVWPHDPGTDGEAVPDPSPTAVMASPDATGTVPLRTSGTPMPAAPLAQADRHALRWVLVAVAAVVLLAAAVWGVRAVLDDDSSSTGASADQGSSPSGPTAGRSDASAAPVDIDPDDYVGLEEGEARRRLSDLGLRSQVERRTNPGTEQAGTVADVDPTGSLAPGTTVSLTVWDEVLPTGPKDQRPEKAPKGEKKPKGKKGRGKG